MTSACPVGPIEIIWEDISGDTQDTIPESKTLALNLWHFV